MHAIIVSKRKAQLLSGWECHRKQENKTKLLLSENEAWCSQQTNGQSKKDTHNKPKVVEW